MILVLFFLLVLLLLFFGVYFFFLISIITGAPYVKTEEKTVKEVIKYFKKKRVAKVADLGSGNGTVIIALAKEGIEAHGFEINPWLVLLTKLKIRKEGVEDKVFVYWADFWKKDLSLFDGIYAYPFGHITGPLRKKLKRELKKGSFVALNVFNFSGWELKEQRGRLYFYEK